MMFGPIVVYAHQDTDEEPEHYFSAREKAGWTPKQYQAAKTFLDSNPLYEVTFEFWLDPDTGGAVCTKMDLGYGEPLVRDPEGEQLTLFPHEDV